MENLTGEQKEQALRDFENSQNRKLRIGKVIVITIASLNVVMAILSVIFNFNILALVVQIALSIALFSGVSWVRYFFAVRSALSVFLTVYSLIEQTAALSPAALAIVLVDVTYAVACSILLFKSECVSEYMYAKKNR